MCGMTYHARIEREARINYIIDTVGIGEPVVKVQRPKDKRYMTLTNTGVIIITGNDNVLITMYIGTIDEALMTYRNATKMHNMPDGLLKKSRLYRSTEENSPERG